MILLPLLLPSFISFLLFCVSLSSLTAANNNLIIDVNCDILEAFSYDDTWISDPIALQLSLSHELLYNQSHWLDDNSNNNHLYYDPWASAWTLIVTTTTTSTTVSVLQIFQEVTTSASTTNTIIYSNSTWIDKLNAKKNTFITIYLACVTINPSFLFLIYTAIFCFLVFVTCAD